MGSPMIELCQEMNREETLLCHCQLRGCWLQSIIEPKQSHQINGEIWSLNQTRRGISRIERGTVEETKRNGSP